MHPADDMLQKEPENPSSLYFCSALLQKWQCVEEPTGKLRLYKCKGMASLFAPRMQALMASGASQLSLTANSDGCNCEEVGFKTSILKRKKLLTKKSKSLLSPACTIVLLVINRCDFVQKDTCSFLSNALAVAYKALPNRAINLKLK